MDGWTISELADRVGTSTDTIRYYERIELLPEPRRSDSGYRLYAPPDLDRLSFIKEAQQFGLRLEQIRELVEIRDEGHCPCGHTRALLQQRLEEIDEQLTSLTTLREQVHGMLGGLGERDASTWPCEPELIQLGQRRRSD